MDPLYVDEVRKGFEVLYDNPPPEALAREGEAANELGLNGPRHGRDKDLAHISPGEIVVPLSAQTPDVLNALYAVMGDRMAHYVVGSGHEQRNPISGLPAFADKGSWFESKRWHFEERDEKNRSLPRNEEEAQKRGFLLYPSWQASEHDNGTGAEERKYAHPDGREVVFDGDTGSIIRDPRYRGTFNYAHQEPGPSDVTDIVRWAKVAGTGVKHIWKDLLPHIRYGGTREQYREIARKRNQAIDPYVP